MTEKKITEYLENLLKVRTKEIERLNRQIEYKEAKINEHKKDIQLFEIEIENLKKELVK